MGQSERQPEEATQAEVSERKEPLLGGCESQRGLERETGVEPATSTLARWRSTTELFPLWGPRRIAKAAFRNQGAGTGIVVPPQWLQTRTTFAPIFFSGAHSSQRGRSVSGQTKCASRSVCARQQRGGVVFDLRFRSKSGFKSAISPATTHDPSGAKTWSASTISPVRIRFRIPRRSK